MLDHPALVHQLAYLVQDHDHFGMVLRKVAPEKRTEAYEAMKPYLRFTAKPLFNYLLV